MDKYGLQGAISSMYVVHEPTLQQSFMVRNLAAFANEITFMFDILMGFH